MWREMVRVEDGRAGLKRGRDAVLQRHAGKAARLGGRWRPGAGRKETRDRVEAPSRLRISVRGACNKPIVPSRQSLRRVGTKTLWLYRTLRHVGMIYGDTRDPRPLFLFLLKKEPETNDLRGRRDDGSFAPTRAEPIPMEADGADKNGSQRLASPYAGMKREIGGGRALSRMPIACFMFHVSSSASPLYLACPPHVGASRPAPMGEGGAMGICTSSSRCTSGSPCTSKRSTSAAVDWLREGSTAGAGG
jgi:hypothetical protein